MKVHFIGAWMLLLALVTTAGAQAPATQPIAGPSYKGTFVIVHGAWGGGWAFRDVEKLLAADGYRVYRPTLSGQGEKSHLSTPAIDLTQHITDISNVLEWDDLHDVILVGHSYGGMVITGVADKLHPRIKQMIYLDAFTPENGESVNDIRSLSKSQPLKVTEKDGFLVPTWLKPDAPVPHDVPMPAKTFSEKIVLKNQDAAAKLPTAYILTVDPGKKPDDDMFFPFYERARARGWAATVMDGDHNVQWSRPRELVKLLEDAAKRPQQGESVAK